MIRTVPILGIVYMVACCGTLAFWCACILIRLIRPKLHKRPGRQGIILAVLVVLFLVTWLMALTGSWYVYGAFGGLPVWGKVEGDRYFLGKANGGGYVEVSQNVYWFSHWLLIVSGGSMVASFTSIFTIATLDDRVQRKAIAKQLDILCLRNDLESLYELIGWIDRSPPLASFGDRNRVRLCDEIRRRTAHVQVLQPPLSVAATPDVSGQQKEMWNRFVQEHENEIAHH